MNILAVNGSPRGAEGNTDILVQAFLQGAREEGATAETVYVKDLSISPCTGCFACWSSTPGVCVHADDMTEMLERVRKADLFVLASPLYGNMVTGIMKVFLDRMLPLSNPAIEQIGDEYVHAPRYDDGVFRFVAISNAGFPETHHFDGLRKTFELMSSGPRAGCSGMIFCAAGPMLSNPATAKQVRWYVDATIQAGREVVRDGVVSPETQTILSHSLAEDPATYAHAINAYWESVGVDLQSPVSYAGEPPTPSEPLRPGADNGTVRSLIARLPSSISPAAAAGLDAVIQFEIADESSGVYYLEIQDGVCNAFEGRHTAPTLTIQSPAQVWLDVCTGQRDGTEAFMSGAFQVRGDMSLLMRFGALFAG